MASPRRIYEVYRCLAANAATIRDFQVARGEKVSGTVDMLLAGDRVRFLRRWGEEMHELCSVIEGLHDDPYIMEATQSFYWASLFAVSGGVTWDEIDFERQRQQAPHTRLNEVNLLRGAVDRVVALGEEAKAAKCFLLWCVADMLYRSATPGEKQWPIDTIMEYDLQEMRKRVYLQPCLAETEGL